MPVRRIRFEASASNASGSTVLTCFVITSFTRIDASPPKTREYDERTLSHGQDVVFEGKPRAHAIRDTAAFTPSCAYTRGRPTDRKSRGLCGIFRTRRCPRARVAASIRGAVQTTWYGSCC